MIMVGQMLADGREGILVWSEEKLVGDFSILAWFIYYFLIF